MHLKYSSVIKVFSFVILLMLGAKLEATVIRGYILDSKTKEPLVGAVIFDKNNTQFNEMAALDGSFSIKKLTPGKHTLVIQILGYTKQEKIVDISANESEMKLEVLMEPESITLDEVEVIAHADKGTNEYARDAERTATNVMNVTSAKTIQLSPDLTIANVLQRISGVTVQRTSYGGDGQYAIIRGMDKRYNYTLINGIKIPSPDDRNRYIPMDIFPSDLIANLEVIKALTPDMEGDAIGGAMNLIMKDAPEKALLNINFSVGYDQLFMDRPFYRFDASGINWKSPEERFGPNYNAKASDFPLNYLVHTPITPLPNITAGISIGNRFFNNRLGIILAVSEQNIYSGSDLFFARPETQPNPGPFPGNLPDFDTKDQRSYSTQQNRLGIHNKIDFILNKNNTISLSNEFFLLYKLISRNTIEEDLATGVGNVFDFQRSQEQLQGIYNSTLHGEHLIKQVLKIDWSLAISKAWGSYPDDGEMSWTITPQISQPDLQGINFYWSHNNDQDVSEFIDISWKPSSLKKNIEFKVGEMYRHKERYNYYNEYALNIVPPSNSTNQVFTTVDSAKFEAPDQGNGSIPNPNTYNVTEDIDAVYGEVKLCFWNRLYILTGVRVEQTDLSYSTPMPDTWPGNTGSQVYTDVLPGFHAKWAITNQQNLRFSYNTSISRPGFFEVIPYFIQGDVFDQAGNPHLQHATAQNFDFRYELFPNPVEQILIGAFYKKISNPIEYSFYSAPIGEPSEFGASTLVIMPQNFGDATNYGFELVLQKFFGNFGISGNYTYTKSRMTIKNGFNYYYSKTTGQDTTSYSPITRPMQGQADNIGNLSAIYKNQRIGLDMVLASVYTGQFISLVNGYSGLNYYSMPNITLDFSFEKKLGGKKNFSIYGKARNLLNTPEVSRILRPNAYYSGISMLPDQDSRSSIVVQKEYYRQNYLIGFRYSF